MCVVTATNPKLLPNQRISSVISNNFLTWDACRFINIALCKHFILMVDSENYLSIFCADLYCRWIADNNPYSKIVYFKWFFPYKSQMENLKILPIFQFCFEFIMPNGGQSMKTKYSKIYQQSGGKMSQFYEMLELVNKMLYCKSILI